MPHLPYSLELHDSEIAAIDVRGGTAIVRFSHAYVHKDGKGWSQAADLTVRCARVLGGKTSFPARVADGTLRTLLGPYHNLLMLPLTTDGEVDLRIELASGDEIEIKGHGIDVVLTTNPVFIENVSIT